MQTQEPKTTHSTETSDGILANNCLLGDEQAFAWNSFAQRAVSCNITKKTSSIWSMWKE